MRSGTDQQGHGGGCALVDVGQPHVKGHSTELEGQTGNNKDQAENQHLVLDLAAGNRLKHFVDIERAGGAIDHGQAVEQKARGQRAQHKVLHGRFGGGRVVSAQGHQRVARQRHELETHVDDQKIVTRDHHKNTQQREQTQGEELTAAQHVAVGCVGSAVNQGDHQGKAGKALEPVAHGVAHDHFSKAVNRGTLGSVKRLQHSDHRQRQQRQRVGGATQRRLHAQVHHRNHASHDQQNDFGVNGDPA